MFGEACMRMHACQDGNRGLTVFYSVCVHTLCRVMPGENKERLPWSEAVMLKAVDVTAVTVSTTVVSLAAYFGFRHGMRELGRNIEGMGRHLEMGMRHMMSGRGSGAEHIKKAA